jgi:hypothetical protein
VSGKIAEAQIQCLLCCEEKADFSAALRSGRNDDLFNKTNAKTECGVLRFAQIDKGFLLHSFISTGFVDLLQSGAAILGSAILFSLGCCSIRG